MHKLAGSQHRSILKYRRKPLAWLQTLPEAPLLALRTVLVPLQRWHKRQIWIGTRNGTAHLELAECQDTARQGGSRSSLQPCVGSRTWRCAVCCTIECSGSGSHTQRWRNKRQFGTPIVLSSWSCSAYKAYGVHDRFPYRLSWCCTTRAWPHLSGKARLALRTHSRKSVLIVVTWSRRA